MEKLKLTLFLLCGFVAFSGFAQEKFFTGVGDKESYSVIELANQDDKFSIFLSFLEASGLDTTLEFTEGYTVFMPTNEAFGEMDLEKLSKITNADNQVELLAFVKNYILSNEVKVYEFEDNHIVDLEGGEKIEVNIPDNSQTIFIGGAEIIQGDIEAKDGVIHVIDKLITPTPKFMY